MAFELQTSPLELQQSLDHLYADYLTDIYAHHSCVLHTITAVYYIPSQLCTHIDFSEFRLFRILAKYFLGLWGIFGVALP